MKVRDRPTMDAVIFDSLPSPAASFDSLLNLRIGQFYAAAANAICDGRLTDWTEMFVETARYSLISRANHDRGLPLATMFHESKGALQDRVTAIENTMVYAPRYVSLVVSNAGLIDFSEHRARARSSFVLYQSLVAGDPQLVMMGRTFDELDVAEDAIRFTKRIVVFDSERIPGSLVYPI